jgi:predicted RNA-binding Zn-ribbon protein involved in translation (DUF1610 family)
MAYKCPRCGEKVQRGHSTGAQAAAGLVGALFYAAFGAFQCEKCGKIPRSEFSPEDQSKMTMGSVMMVVGAIAVLIVVLWLVSTID